MLEPIDFFEELIWILLSWLLTNLGLVSCRFPNDWSSWSIKTTSDMVGLSETGDWVHNKAISMIFITCCFSCWFKSSVSSMNFKCSFFSYSFHACLKRKWKIITYYRCCNLGSLLDEIGGTFLFFSSYVSLLCTFFVSYFI